MKLVVGLGNIGKEYEATKHNAGFMAVDLFAEKNDCGNFSLNSKLKSEILKTKFGDEEIILIKPTTFMNLSGEAVRLVQEYYGIKAEDVIVIYDDLDIDLGKIRIGIFDSPAGHNGIKSIIENTKSKDFLRIRIGIKNETLKNIPSEDLVLRKFNDDEKEKINTSLNNSIEALEMCIKEKSIDAMNKFN